MRKQCYSFFHIQQTGAADTPRAKFGAALIRQPTTVPDSHEHMYPQFGTPHRDVRPFPNLITGSPDADATLCKCVNPQIAGFIKFCIVHCHKLRLVIAANVALLR